LFFSIRGSPVYLAKISALAATVPAHRGLGRCPKTRNSALAR